MRYPQTLNQFLLDHLRGHIDRDRIALVMNDLATIGKIISAKTNRAGLTDLLGAVGKENIQGEQVQKLDEFANELCKEYLSQTGHFAAMASEEDDTVVDLGEYGKDAQLVIAFDPLDGSSNIDINISVGTIFSVHRRLNDIDRHDEQQFLQKGREQLLAGYLVYGTSTQLIFTAGDGVHECTLDPDIGEFFVSRTFVKIPDAVTYYSLNESYLSRMQEQDAAFLSHLKERHQPSSRYAGSLVADFYRNLLKGGVYLYPAFEDEKTKSYKPKLRLNHECKATAFLAEQAGGIAIDGVMNILDMQPVELHQRVPLIVGNKAVIKTFYGLT